MSARRGKPRPAVAAEVERAHNTLEMPEADTDPVVGLIRFGMDAITKIFNDTAQHCPVNKNENLKREIANRMENSMRQLIEAELTYTQSEPIVDQVVEELSFEDNPDMDAKEFVESVDSINDLTNQRVSEYKASLSEDMLQSHAKFVELKAQMNAMFLSQENTDEEDTDMEVENPEDSCAVVDDDDDDEESHEIIPDLDPLTKQPLENPVRNKICRHIYGKDTMLQFIKKNPKTRCPAMGCNNTTFVKASHLVEDPELTAKVAGQPPPAKISRPSPRASSRSPPKAKRGRARR